MGNVGVKPDTLADGAINERTDTVITAADEIIFGDVTDSNNLKKDTVQGILNLASSLSDSAYSLAILNRFEIARNHDLPAGVAGDGVFDEFSTDSLATKTGATYDAANDKYGNAGSKTTFSYTGGNQTYVVPAGVTSITFKAWGAGGGGGGASGDGCIGGAGGYVEEVLSVTPGETLNIKVGGGGVYEGTGGSKKGGGGGWTSIDRSATYLAGAGGGGGGSIGSNSDNGGAGGGTTGGAGIGTTGTQGQGGTQSAGGAAGPGGGAGASLTGGAAAASASANAAGGYNGGGTGDGDNTTWTSGGGGGGYFGGGSGGNSSSNNGPGGGGSSYAPTGTNTQSSGGVAANSGDTDFPGGVGDGGAVAGNGENGYAVVISALNNVTLIPSNTTIVADPSDLRIDLVITENDALTLGTDLTVKGSRDGGTTETLCTLTKIGTLPGGESHVKAEVDVSGQPTGTAMRYKLESFNNKDFDLHYAYQLPIYL